MAQLRRNGYSDDTMRMNANCMKHFFRVLRNTTELPYTMMMAFSIRKNRGLPEWPVLTRNEEAQLFGAAPTLRDQALLALLIEGGLRIGEAVSLDVGSIELRDSGAAWILMPNVREGQKTRARRLPLAKYAKLLEAYLLTHPQRDDPTAPLLLTFERSGSKRLKPGSALMESGAGQTVDRIRLRSGVRRFRRHDLRHTAITRAQEAGVEGVDLSERFWGIKNSRQVARYTHHSDARKELMARQAAGVDDHGRPLQSPAVSDEALDRILKKKLKKLLLEED